MAQHKPSVETPRRVALDILLRFPEDVSLIRETHGLSYQGLAELLMVSKPEVWHWAQGDCLPKEPLICQTVIEWARQIRVGAGTTSS